VVIEILCTTCDSEDIVIAPLWVTAIVAALLLVFVAAECFARWWIRHRGHYYVLPPGLRLRLRPDPDVFPHLERRTRFDVNADGERGDEVPRGNGLFRILVAGGSQPEGYLLDQETAWPGALQRLLQTPACLQRLEARWVHVGSIARSGVGSEALDLMLERVLPRYPRLQLIIIMVGATDVLRWLEYGAPDVMPSVRIPDVFRCHPEGPFGWKPGQLALVELLLRARRRWWKPIEVHDRAGKWIEQARAMRARATVIRSTMPDPTPMLDRFDVHFRRLLWRARAHADRVIVVRQPWFDRSFSPEEAAHMWHGGVGQAWRSEITTYYSFEVISTLMSHVDARAAAAAEAMGVEQLDLMPVLEQNLMTYYDGFHVTPAGARAVATAVGTMVVSRSMRGVSAPEKSEETVTGETHVTCVASRAS
jgi:lysophospholipase L1-like esterase